ncbi:MAG: hypothetical protein NXH95_09755 [Pseudomonadaceae bacterium]|nr:hypothetical protein [Pseudomonadaceae bacterium]
MTSAYQEPGDARGTFLGHPKGLLVLFFAEMWERFSYYGMRALLIFYLVQHWMFSDSEAGIIYGAYTALVYIDLSPKNLTVANEIFPIKLYEGKSRYEAQDLHRRADHRDLERA